MARGLQVWRTHGGPFPSDPWPSDAHEIWPRQATVDEAHPAVKLKPRKHQKSLRERSKLKLMRADSSTAGETTASTYIRSENTQHYCSTSAQKAHWILKLSSSPKDEHLLVSFPTFRTSTEYTYIINNINIIENVNGVQNHTETLFKISSFRVTKWSKKEWSTSQIKG